MALSAIDREPAGAPGPISGSSFGLTRKETRDHDRRQNSRVDTLQRQRRAVVFDPEDPLLLGLDIAPLSVQQLERAAIPAWAASAVGAEDTPLIMHGRLGDQRAVMFAFDPNKSNLPHLAAFPLLMANAIDWLTPGREAILRGGLGNKTDIQPRPLADVPASGAAA